MSIPNKVIIIPINKDKYNKDNIYIDDNITTIYKKIINNYYNKNPILPKHLYIWFQGYDRPISLGFNYNNPEIKIMDPYRSINVDKQFVDSGGNHIINEFSYNMNMTLQDYFIKYNNLDINIREIYCIDIFSVVNLIRDKLPSSEAAILELYNGYFRKYWKFIDDKDISLLKGYEHISKEYLLNINKNYKTNHRNLYKINNISRFVADKFVNNYGKFTEQINLLKINIINPNIKVYIDLLYLFLNTTLSDQCPFMKLHINKNIHVKIRKLNLDLHNTPTSDKYINRSIIEDKWIKSFTSESNYGGIPTYIKSSDTILFKIINNIHNLLYSIVINSKAEISIIIDEYKILSLKNINEMKQYDNYILDAIQFIRNIILPVINTKYEIIHPDSIIIDRNILHLNRYVNPIQLHISNISLINRLSIDSIDTTKKNLDNILKCAYPFIRYIDPIEIKEHNKLLDTNHTIYCQWIRISNYNSMELRCAIIIKQLNSGKSPEDIIEYISIHLNITEEDAIKYYEECNALLDDKKDKYNYIRESGIDIKIKIETHGIIITLENIKSIYDYNNLLKFFNSILKIHREHLLLDEFKEICDMKYKSPRKSRETVKTPRKSRETVKTPRKSHETVKSPRKSRETVKTPRKSPVSLLNEPEDSSDTEEDSDSDDFLGGGKTTYNISQYYIRRLKNYNKDAYGFKVDSNTIYDTEYSRLCQNKANFPGWYYKHPIILNEDEMAKIDSHPEGGPDSYANSKKRDEFGNYYIAPEFWDIDRGISIRKNLIYDELDLPLEDLKRAMDNKDIRQLTPTDTYADKLIPYLFSKGVTDKTILQRKNYDWFIQNNIDEIYSEKNVIKMKDLDSKKNPKGLKMFCAGIQKKNPTTTSAVKPAKHAKPATKPAKHAKPATKPATKPAKHAKPATKPATKPAKHVKPAVNPANPSKPTESSKSTKLPSSTVGVIVKGSTKKQCELNDLCRLTPDMCAFLQQPPDKIHDVFLKIGIEEEPTKKKSSTFQAFIISILKIINPSNTPLQQIEFTEKQLPPHVFSVLNNGILLSHFVTNRFDSTKAIKNINTNPIWKFYKEYTSDKHNHPYLTRLYNAFYNYLDYVNDPNNVKDDIYLTGFLEYHIGIKLEKKISIIIFEIINDNIKIKNPLKGSDININENYVFIIKYKSIYEPILYKSKKSKSATYIFNNKSHEKSIKNTVNGINNIIKTFIRNKNDKKIYDSNLDYETVVKLLNTIKHKAYLPKYGYINLNNQMTHLICKNGLILPINSTPFPIYLQGKKTIKPIFHIDEENLLEYSIYYQKFHEASELSRTFKIDSICVEEDKKTKRNMVMQVIINKSYVPLKPMVHLKKPIYSHKMIYNNKNLFEIDNIISQNTISPQSIIIEDIYDEEFKINTEIYNEYIILFINIINTGDLKDKNDIIDIIDDDIMIYNNKIRKINDIIKKINGSHKIIAKFIAKFIKVHTKKTDFNNILYKFTYNLVNHGLDIDKLLNIKPIEYEDIVNNINEGELYFTLNNMEYILNYTFRSNSIDNITSKYKNIRHKIIPVEMFRENINYFNERLTGNYHLSAYRLSNIIILQLLSNPDNSKVFNDKINTLYDMKHINISIKLVRNHLIDSLVSNYEKYKGSYDIFKSYFSSYNLPFKKSFLNRENIQKNIKLLKEKIEHSKRDFTIYDLRLISILYGVNIIIFTLQNENMINFLNKNHEHNNNPKITIRKIFENTDYKRSKYLLLNHRFLDIELDEISNNFSVIYIDDKELIDYKDISINIKKELNI